jgi:hypothetical protein
LYNTTTNTAGYGSEHPHTDGRDKVGKLRHERRKTARNCTKDEGRPFAAGRQGQAANHLKLLGAKALVVSVEEKAPRRCQVWTTKMSASEPRRTCRNVKDDIKTRGVSRSWEELGRYLLTGRVVSGIHVA